MESKEVLRLKISLPEGGSDVIVVHETDEPVDLANIFCVKHNLGKDSLENLVDYIEKNIDFLIEDEKNSQGKKYQLVKHAIILPQRNRPASPMLFSLAKQVRDSLRIIKSGYRASSATIKSNSRASSAITKPKRFAEKDDINRYGIRTPNKSQRTQKKIYVEKWKCSNGIMMRLY